jgi:hypothetical protein
MISLDQARQLLVTAATATTEQERKHAAAQLVSLLHQQSDRFSIVYNPEYVMVRKGKGKYPNTHCATCKIALKPDSDIDPWFVGEVRKGSKPYCETCVTEEVARRKRGEVS